MLSVLTNDLKIFSYVIISKYFEICIHDNLYVDVLRIPSTLAKYLHVVWAVKRNLNKKSKLRIKILCI